MISISGKNLNGFYDIKEDEKTITLLARDPITTYFWVVDLVHTFGDHNLVIDGKEIPGFVYHVHGDYYMSGNAIEIIYWKSTVKQQE